jgi:hypothetical protein
MQTQSSFEEHVAGNPKGKTDYNFDPRCKSYSISNLKKKHNQCYMHVQERWDLSLSLVGFFWL